MKVDYVVLHNQALPKFCTHKGHGAGVKVGKGMHMEMFLWVFLWFYPTFFPPFSLSFPPFSFAFSCAFCMLGHLSCTRLVLMGLQYEGTTVNQTLLVQTFDHFILLWKPFAPFLYMLESLCSYYYDPAYYHIKWYWNWKIACINLAMRFIQKVLDSNYT